ncbi:hypothetical protein BLA29_002622 [Euroglyphus maynei]|uniref:Uncharacterized protein n=1 Tax=Euroglyphus maynei TaxID=6958 RepID=A0A1Y3B903_EURMA|nr:hypothetical protein BLA29_002622 [Euroglyphus maynei]
MEIRELIWDHDPPDQNQNETPMFENENSQQATNEISRVDDVLTQQNDDAATVPESSQQQQIATITFEIILEQIEETEKEEWISRLIEKVNIKYKGRIPRGGWDKITTAYNDRLNTNESKQDIKNLYNKIKSSQVTSKNQEEEEETMGPEIKNVQLFKQTKQKLQKNIDKYVINKEEKDRTRKIYSEEIQHDVLDIINSIVKDPTIEGKIETIKDYNNMIYACQKTYMEVTERTGKESTWKEAINKKIKELKNDFQILEKCDPTEKPSKEVKRICSKNRIHSNMNEKVVQLKDQIFEKIEMHQKRLRIAENRKEFRKNNRNFEFNRKRFYRNIDQKQMRISETINDSDTLEFWQNIWAREEKEESHEELIDALPTNSLNVEITNEKIKDIVENVIKYLPAWKTPGHDCVHNFFIKKIKGLHTKLVEVIIEAVNEPDRIDPEMYVGTTYLIPKKENASQPKELRPITCLPNIYKLISKVVQTLWVQEEDAKEQSNKP